MLEKRNKRETHKGSEIVERMRESAVSWSDQHPYSNHEYPFAAGIKVVSRGRHDFVVGRMVRVRNLKYEKMNSCRYPKSRDFEALGFVSFVKMGKKDPPVWDVPHIGAEGGSVPIRGG